jgi:CopG family nickel-responsive transcriptional regulator
MSAPPKSPVSRISVSLPPMLLDELDSMVQSQGYGSRSQAIGGIVNYQLGEHKKKVGNEVMAGTITLLYDLSSRGLQKRLAEIQFKHIKEVISSLHVHLNRNQMMEVLLVQGPARQLQTIANELTTQKGVLTGHLHLLAASIPQVHIPQEA